MSELLHFGSYVRQSDIRTPRTQSREMAAAKWERDLRVPINWVDGFLILLSALIIGAMGFVSISLWIALHFGK